MMKKDIDQKLNEMEKKVNDMKEVVKKMSAKKSELDQPRGLMGNLKHLFG